MLVRTFVSILEAALAAYSDVFFGDGLGIVGQIARMIPLVGDWLAGLIQVSALNYCSEGHCEDERTATADFCAGGNCQVSPADIDQECCRRGWECWTFKLAA